MDTNRDHDHDQTAAPSRLVEALRRAQSRPVFVPPTLDEAILRAARKHLAPAAANRRGLWDWVRWPAVAAACLMLALMVAHFVRVPPRAQPAFAREDLNHDGRVDILDAFQLARELQSGTKPGLGPDLNGDGALDRRDVEIIAARAVRLEKGGRS